MHELILERLSAIAADRGCRMLYACESGSRAWGFASTDSDYDVRFIYSHPLAWYLGLQERKDTIELALAQELDLAGWELRKALRLFAGCNLALNEWLDSPVRYLDVGGLRTRLQELIPRYFNPRKALHHYLSQAHQAYSARDAGEIRLKKLCYALRATLAATWIERERSMPPTPLQAMLQAELLPQALLGAVHDVLAWKQAADESCRVALAPGLEQWLSGRLAELDGLAVAVPSLTHPGFAALDELFLALLRAAGS